mmetsp:Transcript_11974/g.31671  ORF Transcript_11974/g.31671 Transcript_11974/m.31671 type:complete len:118 (-) Transcript_11974:138-491(-)
MPGQGPPPPGLFVTPEQRRQDVAQGHRTAYDWTFNAMLQQALLVTGLGGISGQELLSPVKPYEFSEELLKKASETEVEPRIIRSSLLETTSAEVAYTSCSHTAKDAPMYVICTEVEL